MLSRHTAEKLDGFVALDSAGGTGRSLICSCADMIGNRRRRPCRFAETVADVLDRPRTPTLPLRHQNTTSCNGSGSRCLALQIVPRLSAYKERRTERDEHERSCEPKNRFGETRDGSRVDRAKNERLQVKDTGTVRTG